MGIRLVFLGDKFGFYEALAAAGPLTSAELASRTGTAGRYVHEWATAPAAGGYINFDSATERFSILPEQAMRVLPEGPIALDDPRIVQLPKERVYNSIGG